MLRSSLQVLDPAMWRTVNVHRFSAIYDGNVTHRIVVLALPGIDTFDLTCAMQVFGHPSAGAGAGARSLYDFGICGPGARMVTTSDGLSLRPHADLSALRTADTVLVPGYQDAARVPPPPVVLQSLADAAEGARIMSFCVGAFALGHAGLLDGRRATTHWDETAALAVQFPRAMVDPDPLYIDEGDILTSAGLAAALDLALHVVRRDHGTAAAAAIARWNVISPHREGGQAQFIPQPVATNAAAGLSSTCAWALQRLDQPLTLTDLAAHAHCSERTLTRRFRAEVGLSPKRWLLQARLRLARQLLESTHLTIEQVASRAGYPTANALRFHFDATLGIQPTSYRSTFQGNGSPNAMTGTNSGRRALTT